MILKKYFQRLALAAAALFLTSACTTVEVYIPTARVYSSEIGKKESLLLNINRNNGGLYELTSSPNTRPPAFNSVLESKTNLNGILEYGALDWLTIGVGLGIPWHVNGKIQAQLFGPSRFSEDEGTSMSIYADVTYSNDSESGDQATLFGPGGFRWKATGTIAGASLGASIGYRFNPNFMTYIGYAEQNIRSKVVVDQEPADDNSDPGGQYSDSAKGKSRTALLGLDFGTTSVSLVPTFEYSEIHWKNFEVYESKVGASLVIWLR